MDIKGNIIKILIIGAGVIGTTYSWQLQKAGIKTIHLVRKNKMQLYTEHGITIRCLDFRVKPWEYDYELYRPDFVNDFSDRNDYDYILVSVNSNQLIDILPMLREKSGNATIVFLQNMRIGDDEILDQFLERKHYVLCYPFKVGGGRENTAIETFIFGSKCAQTVIGKKDGAVTEEIKKIFALFEKADLNPKIITQIVPYIRTHYVWAACSVAAYMKAITFDRFIEDDSLKESYKAMREGLDICIKQGINPKTSAPACYFYLPSFILLPLTRWIYKKRGMKEMFEGHIKHSPLEMKDMYETLLKAGEKYGIKMPVYEAYGMFVQEYFKNLNKKVSA